MSNMYFLHACKRLKKVLSPEDYQEWLKHVNREGLGRTYKPHWSATAILAAYYDWPSTPSGYRHWHIIWHSLLTATPGYN